ILGLPQVQYAFLELPKYTAGDSPTSLIDRWAYFFREAKNLDVVPPALSEGPFRAALEVARTSAFSREEWDAYDRAKMAEQDARGAFAIVRQESLAEGRAEGIVEGRAEGRAEGKVEGIVEGKRQALLQLLSHRGLTLTPHDQQRIATCTDLALLDRWFTNAM